MLKPIYRVNCSPALAACQQLMRRFALWLCDRNVGRADVTQAKLQANMGSAIEADWLWLLIAGVSGTKGLLERAQHIADLPPAEKQGLKQWIQTVSTLAEHFSPAPPAPLPANPPNNWGGRNGDWMAFKALMLAFYEEGLHDGLPYQANGSPTNLTAQRVTYALFKQEFRAAHRLDPHPDAHEVCVLCGGPLLLPAIDHWLAKTAFPLLAVCADNLMPICAECNEAPQKGQKDVHTNGTFSDWFHPYLRHANGAIQLRYDDRVFAIRVDSATPADSSKVRNLDSLLSLTNRWTREFKAEYRRLQREIQKSGGMTTAQLQQRFMEYRDGLTPEEPHHEIHLQVATALLEPARLQAIAQTTP